MSIDFIVFRLRGFDTQLARRLFYSFRSEGADRLILGDIGRFFPNRELATFAFEIFDKVRLLSSEVTCRGFDC